MSLSLHELGPSLLSDKEFAWIDIEGQARPELLERLRAIFPFHPLALADLFNPGQRPKTEGYGGFVLHICHYPLSGSTPACDTAQLGIVFNERVLLTVRNEAIPLLDLVRERLRGSQGMMAAPRPDYLAYALVDTAIDAFFSVGEKIGDALDALEHEVLSDSRPEHLIALHEVKHHVRNLRRVAWSHRDALDDMYRGDLPFVQSETRLFLRDTHDHCLQLVEITEMCRDQVSELTNSYLSMLNNRMSEVMKVLTIMSSIFIPLTFLVGVYGMNFDHMPELHWRYGYGVTWGIMLITAGSMAWFFRRKGWWGKKKLQEETTAGGLVLPDEGR